MVSFSFLFSKRIQAPQVFNENVFMLFATLLVSAADNSQTDFEAETACRLFTGFNYRNDENWLISLSADPDF